ncbi:hypothetical protein [Halopiger djelfimassiliensis]|uniref:hypothetical protein n=1 Tax=Halopiger djelfimassiliensis TaxID=1293047 RepID=UPI0012B5EACE|nr:hypothetical protein [Halopiger djelfimassiliensis]
MVGIVRAQSPPEIGVYCGVMLALCGVSFGAILVIVSGMIFAIMSLLAWVYVRKLATE